MALKDPFGLRAPLIHLFEWHVGGARAETPVARYRHKRNNGRDAP